MARLLLNVVICYLVVSACSVLIDVRIYVFVCFVCG